MNSRERMRAALSGRKTDRVPFFPCVAMDHASVAMGHQYEEAIADPRLGCRWMVEAGQRYGSDAVRVCLSPPASWFEEKRIREEGGQLVQVDVRSGRINGFFDVQGGGSLFPIEKPEPVRTMSQAQELAYPAAKQLLADGCADTARELTRAAHQAGLFIVGMAGGQTLNYLVTEVGDNEEALLLMADSPEVVHRIFTVATDASVEVIKAFADIGVDCVYIGDSYTSGSVISPRMYEEYCVPAYRRAAEAAHGLGLLVYKHCCGNYNPFLSLLERNGLDGIEGMDPTSGMSVARTLDSTGGKLCLIGGVSCLTVLKGTVEQVRAEASDCIRAGGHEGRYVLGTACAVPRYSPPENIHALATAARDSMA